MSLAIVPLLLAGCLGAMQTTSSGLGYPSGPTLAEFGLDERCRGEDASCTDRAIALVAEILGSLGAPYDGPAEPVEAGARFTIDAQHDPPFEWRAGDGSRGNAANVAVDLTALVRREAEPAFAVIGGIGDPEAPRFVVTDDRARELLEALYVAP